MTRATPRGIRKRPRQIVRGRKGTLQGGKSEHPAFRTTPNLPKVLGRESLEMYWHPNRSGAEHAPADFLQRLQAMNADLHCTRPPAHAPLARGLEPAWLFWYKRGRITHPICPGWLLLFVWRNAFTNTPEPLDERCFAVLYGGSALKHGNGEAYFTRCVEEKMADAQKSRERAYQNRRHAKQRELTDSRRITSAGTGSKFARHHDGSVVPTRGDLAWHLENRRRILPPELIAAEDEAMERGRAAAADARVKIRKDLGITVK